MRSTRDLGRLASRVAARCDGYRHLAAVARETEVSVRDRLVAHVCINMQNSWAEFCRAYTLSVILEPIRLGGSVIILGEAGVKTEHDVMATVMRRFRRRVYNRGGWRRRDEPAWHDPNTLLRTFEDLKASNVGDIRGALSLGSSVFDDLPVFRNFYAHRSEHTAVKARRIADKYGIPRLEHPTEILCRVPLQAAQPVILEWIDDIWVTVRMLCR